MSDRHAKWSALRPGYTIAAGQPWRIELASGDVINGRDFDEQVVADWYDGERGTVFVDSTWRAKA